RYQSPSHWVKTLVTRCHALPGGGFSSSCASTVSWLARTPAPASMQSRDTTKAAIPMATARFHVRPSVMVTGRGVGPDPSVGRCLSPPLPLASASSTAGASDSVGRALVVAPEGGVVITIGAWDGCGVVVRKPVGAARPIPTAGSPDRGRRGTVRGGRAYVHRRR